MRMVGAPYRLVVGLIPNESKRSKRPSMRRTVATKSAQEHGLPLDWFVMALQLRLAPRTLSAGDSFSAPLALIVRSVTMGCTSSNRIARSVLATPLLTTQQAAINHQRARLRTGVHVDDASQTATAIDEAPSAAAMRHASNVSAPRPTTRFPVTVSGRSGSHAEIDDAAAAVDDAVIDDIEPEQPELRTINLAQPSARLRKTNDGAFNLLSG